MKQAHLYTISDIYGNIRYVGVTINPRNKSKRRWQ